MNYNLDNPDIYRDIIILYCPKKVGSTSLVSSIRLSATDKYYVFHTHEDDILTSPDKLNNLTVQDILKNTCVFNKFTNQYRKIYIIDIFRTPIERKMSEFFEELVTLHFNNLPENLINYPIEKIITRFNDIFPYILTTDYYKDKYNIPFPDKFDFDNKYISYSSNNITWVKLRLQDSNIWSDILTQILGTEIIVIKDYETQYKFIGDLYSKFKQYYRLPYNYYKLMEEDKELQFYLTFQDRNNYLNKWNQQTTDIYIPFNKHEFIFYDRISNQNKFYDIKKNGHYFDNGCSCDSCFMNRKLIINDIKKEKNNFNIKNYKPILHDDISTYKCNIFVKCYNRIDNLTDIIYTQF